MRGHCYISRTFFRFCPLQSYSDIMHALVATMLCISPESSAISCDYYFFSSLPDLAENDEILKFLQFVGGGKKLKKIQSGYITHPYLAPIRSSLPISDPFGPPSPDIFRKPFTISRARLYTIDIGEFERARARSRPKKLL